MSRLPLITCKAIIKSATKSLVECIPPPTLPPPNGAAPQRAPPIAPQKSRASLAACRAGSNGDEREKKERCASSSARRTQSRPCVCAPRGTAAPERDGGANYYHLAGSYRITHCRRARDHALATRGLTRPAGSRERSIALHRLLVHY
ncbi:unnamed protein product [Colias eurytheme]|nr:unnamed protein product [Colias eurytheme]